MSSGAPEPRRRPIDRVIDVIDRFLSDEILSQGRAERARARILIVQALAVALIGSFSAANQILIGESEFAPLGLTLVAFAVLVPVLLRRARSHVWVAGLLVGALFVVLTGANLMTAGQAVGATIFLTTIPLFGTLAQGFRWGLLWSALTISELFLLYALVRSGVEPRLVPTPWAVEVGYLRASILVAVLTSGSGLLHALFNDHTARRVERFEGDIARNRAFYRNMLDTSPDGLFTIDASGRTDFVNQTLVRLLGYESVEPLRGLRLAQFLLGPDVDSLRASTLDASDSVAMECAVLDRSGERIPVEVATTSFRLQNEGGQVFRVRDIRRFREADREAKLLRATFDQATVGVAVLEMDSEVVYANDAYLDLVGFRREDMIGRRLLDMNRTAESHDALRSIRDALLAGELVTIPRMDWSRFAQGPDYVDVRAFAIQPPGEDRPRWGTFIRDVSHLVDLEREVARAERIDSLGKLAGGIAHDFNNLLTVIMGQVDILTEDLDADHWAREYLATIMDACERSAALTSKVLDFSRKQSLRPEVFVAARAIRDMLPILRHLVPERIAIDVAVDDAADARVRCDPSRFEQILLNLVANARDAIEESGTISIRVRLGRAKQAATDDGATSEVEIEVSDDGTGMPREIQDRIFDPFFTTKPVGEGTGLGLSTVHGIVHQSGGRLEVDTAPGRGTTLRVFLPSTNAALTSSTPGAPVPRDGSAGDQGVVLVVEDNEAVRALVARTVERLGFEVVEAANGSEAIERIEAPGAEYEALVSDIVMPGASGVELARCFRSRFANRRIVLMSGYAEDEIGPLEALPSDIRFVQKPLTSATLAAALERSSRLGARALERDATPRKRVTTRTDPSG